MRIRILFNYPTELCPNCDRLKLVLRHHACTPNVSRGPATILAWPNKRIERSKAKSIVQKRG